MFENAFDKAPCPNSWMERSDPFMGGNWLKNRKWRVGINGKMSKWRRPSNICNGQVLFHLFINDLELGVNGGSQVC